MARISNFKQDLQREEEGQWFDWELGIRVKIANVNNRKFQDYLRRLTKPYIRKFRNQTAEPGLQLSLFKKAAAKFLVLDWENIDDDNDQPVPYSSDQCLQYFEDESLREFLGFVIDCANANELYRQQMDEESEGN